MDNYLELLAKTPKKVRGHHTVSISSIFESLSREAINDQPDSYGTGELISAFQDEIAQCLGKEQGVFFPSGTMAQQIALRIWCDEKALGKVAYHPLCHLEIHEQRGLQELHGIHSVLLGNPDRLFDIADLEAAEAVAVVLFELPQREIGGQLPSWESLVAMTGYCRMKGYRVHLDGARLFETLPFYHKTAAEVCALFDSVYISFYKGFGGITGAMLTGPADFVEKSKIWKRRHGGDLHALYPYILSARQNFRLRKDRMADYWQSTQDYAHRLKAVEGLKLVPEEPVCNMFHVYFSQSPEAVKAKLIRVMEQCGIALFGGIGQDSQGGSKAELWFGDAKQDIGQDDLNKALDLFSRLMSEA